MLAGAGGPARLTAVQLCVFDTIGFSSSLDTLQGMQACAVYRSILLTCTVGSLLVIARQFTPSQDTDSLKAVVKVHLQSSRKPLSVMDLSESQQPITMTQPKNAPGNAMMLKHDCTTVFKQALHVPDSLVCCLL